MSAQMTNLTSSNYTVSLNFTLPEVGGFFVRNPEQIFADTIQRHQSEFTTDSETNFAEMLLENLQKHVDNKIGQSNPTINQNGKGLAGFMKTMYDFGFKCVSWSVEMTMSYLDPELFGALFGKKTPRTPPDAVQNMDRCVKAEASKTDVHKLEAFRTIMRCIEEQNQKLAADSKQYSDSIRAIEKAYHDSEACMQKLPPLSPVQIQAMRFSANQRLRYHVNNNDPVGKLAKIKKTPCGKETVETYEAEEKSRKMGVDLTENLVNNYKKCQEDFIEDSVDEFLESRSKTGNSESEKQKPEPQHAEALKAQAAKVKQNSRKSSKTNSNRNNRRYTHK